MATGVAERVCGDVVEDGAERERVRPDNRDDAHEKPRRPFTTRAISLIPFVQIGNLPA